MSQDREEVFLTFATFDKDYVEYVSGNLNAEVGSSRESKPGPFLRMNEFGPFITTNKSHMKCLGYYVLAFTLQECVETDGRGVMGQGNGREEEYEVVESVTEGRQDSTELI